MEHVRYLKTNLPFLSVLAVVLAVIIFYTLRMYYPEQFNRNVPIAIIMGIIIVLIIYNVPLKLPKSKEPFDDF